MRANMVHTEPVRLEERVTFGSRYKIGKVVLPDLPPEGAPPDSQAACSEALVSTASLQHLGDGRPFHILQGAYLDATASGFRY